MNQILYEVCFIPFPEFIERLCDVTMWELSTISTTNLFLLRYKFYGKKIRFYYKTRYSSSNNLFRKLVLFIIWHDLMQIAFMTYYKRVWKKVRKFFIKARKK